MIQAAAEGAGAGAAQTIAQLSKELEELTYALEEKEASHDEHIGEMVQAGDQLLVATREAEERAQLLEQELAIQQKHQGNGELIQRSQTKATRDGGACGIDVTDVVERYLMVPLGLSTRTKTAAQHWTHTAQGKLEKRNGSTPSVSAEIGRAQSQARKVSIAPNVKHKVAGSSSVAVPKEMDPQGKARSPASVSTAMAQPTHVPSTSRRPSIDRMLDKAAPRLAAEAWVATLPDDAVAE